MSLLSALLFPIKVVVQVSVILAVYWMLSLGLFYFVSPMLPGYYEDSSLSDVQAILLTLLLWDRFFGPYSSLLRDTAKVLYAAKHKQEEE